MKLNCLIIDDEPGRFDLLEDFIQKVPYLNLVARCEGRLRPSRILKKEEIDLVKLIFACPN